MFILSEKKKRLYSAFTYEIPQNKYVGDSPLIHLPHTERLNQACQGWKEATRSNAPVIITNI
jgi:hypothetical protein